LLLKKLINKKYFIAKKKLDLVSKKKKILFILSEKHFSKIMKNLEMLYYLLIILNLILKLLIAIYFILNFFFQFYPLEFDLI